MRKAVIGLLAAFALSWAPAAYAADNNTEFGIEDDLTVLGTSGVATPYDPDVEIKGFTVFGATQAAYPGGIQPAAGNVVINAGLTVSSGAYILGGSTITGGSYFGGASTFAAGAYFTGISSFTAGPGGIYIKDGAANEVLKKDAATGAMKWAPDNDSGASGLTGTELRLLMIKQGGTGSAPSLFLQDADDGHNITMIAGSSMTILGDGTNGLGVSGAAKIDGALSVLNANTFTVGSGLTSLGGALTVTGVTTLNGDTSISGANTFTVGSGLTSLGGALNVAGASSLAGALTVNNSAQFGSGAAKSTFTADGSLYMVSGGTIALSGAGSHITLPNLPAVANDAANKQYVDSQISLGGPWTRDDAIRAVKLSTITDNVGIGIAAPLAKLHVSSASANAGDMLLAVSTGTDVAQEVFTVDAAGDTMAKGNVQLGLSTDTYHGINTAPVADTALSIAGQNAAGKYAAKFYSGDALAAWIRKK